MQELEQLKKKVNGSFEPEDRKYVEDLEKRLRYEIVKEGFTRNSVVEEYIAYLNREIESCNNQLSSNEDLDDRARLKLFARKQACRDFLSHFEPHRAEVEQTIKQTLDEATRQG